MSEQNNAIKRPKRPDGISIDRYKGNEKWSYRRWAWEFLRRNDEFIAACDAVDRKEKTEAEVAQEFFLLQFKHCNRGYKSKVSPPPKFIVRTISKKTNLTTIRMDEKPSVKSVEISGGQVWLRFDLNHEFVVRGSLDAQIRVAKRSLHLVLDEYAGIINKKLPSKRKPERAAFLDLLRRLDAISGSEVKWKGLAALYPEKFSDLDSDQRSKVTDSLIRSARLHAKETYLTLATHSVK